MAAITNSPRIRIMGRLWKWPHPELRNGVGKGNLSRKSTVEEKDDQERNIKAPHDSMAPRSRSRTI
jgi:hypothetical protein